MDPAEAWRCELDHAGPISMMPRTKPVDAARKPQTRLVAIIRRELIRQNIECDARQANQLDVVSSRSRKNIPLLFSPKSVA
jgi:hypothetical protein